MIEIDVKKQLAGAAGPLHLRLQLEIERGEFIVLYGPSGAGKTSTLRMLAGLLEPDSGRITVNQKNWFYPAQRKSLPPGERKLGFVFQDYALFPNMTVRENLAFALPAGGDESVIDTELEVFGLTQLADQRPERLSGGQQQRVALARTLVQRPDILLLDEPLSAQDDALRHRLRDHLQQFHQQSGCTTILVTHHLGDIFALADRVLHLEDGKIQRQGSAADVLLPDGQPTEFTLQATVLQVTSSTLTVAIHGQTLPVALPDNLTCKPGDMVTITCSPQGMQVAHPPQIARGDAPR